MGAIEPILRCFPQLQTIELEGLDGLEDILGMLRLVPDSDNNVLPTLKTVILDVSINHGPPQPQPATSVVFCTVQVEAIQAMVGSRMHGDSKHRFEDANPRG